MACTERFIAHLRDRGMRMTPQREMVLAALHDLVDHESAEEIFRRVQLRSTAVDRSTVYRTLELLRGMSMLSVTETADGQRRYALTGLHSDHVHLVCRACGREIEAEAGSFAELVGKIRTLYGFDLDLGHRPLTGLCQRCDESALR
jgi:Fur family ferric uptake transcriptional regulator